MSISTFALFNSFPPEIHSLILSSCPPNDLTCLRLTCKYLYNLSASLPQTKTPLPITNVDSPTPLCTSLVLFNGDPQDNIYSHHYKCHSYSYTEAVQRAQLAGLPAPPDRKGCRNRRWGTHCECFTRKERLCVRLRTWMPRGMAYCDVCKKFTRRKRGHGGRCYHGSKKPRKRSRNYWTYRKRRGGFAWQLWKKWFNNRAMNNLERRLRGESCRKGGERYGLRKLEPKRVETKHMRMESLGHI